MCGEGVECERREWRGVVTYRGSKLNQMIKAIFGRQSRDQGDLQTAKSMDQECTATI